MTLRTRRGLTWIPALAAALVAAHAPAQSTAPATSPAPDRPTVILAIGAEGAPEFGAEFARESDRWSDAARRAGAELLVIGRERVTAAPASPTTAAATRAATEPATDAGSDKERLRNALAAAAADKINPLYLVMIGHGTYDGKDAKLNLQGPDVSDSELAEWLKPLARPIAIIDCTSASGPFLPRLSAKNRVVITATRAGSEINYARFGLSFAEALADPAADLDHDGQTSLLEAFLAASHRTADWYKQQGRLMTEHALLDDNGDNLGIGADFFDGLRPVHKAKDNTPLDGPRAHQWHLVKSPAEAAMSPDARARRDAIELQIEALRTRKPDMPPDTYYAQLEPLLLQLGRIYQSQESPGASPPPLPAPPPARPAPPALPNSPAPAE